MATLDEYMNLVRASPLVSIADDAQLDAAIAVYERLTQTPAPSAGQLAYMSALVDLITTYEEAHVPIRTPSGVEVVKYLMEEHGLKQRDMDFAFGNKAVTSAVLRGKRPMGLTYARRLSERFKLPLGTVKTRIRTGMLALRERLSQAFIEQ